MRKAAFFLCLIITSVNTMAQNSADTLKYTRAADGSEYKIFTAPKGTKLAKGNFMEMNIAVKYKDSLLYSSADAGMPQFAPYDTAVFPSPFKDIFKTIHTGDSIVVRVSSDSLIAKGQGAPFMHSGEYLYQQYAITNCYTTKEQVDSAQKTHVALAKEIANKKQEAQLKKLLADNKGQIEADSKTIEAYLAKNKIKAIKAKLGTYVVIKKAGSGKKLDWGDIASVNYTGRSFSTHKVFDSNTDPAFKHVQPFDVNMSDLGAVILGWIDALEQMHNGTKATIYIPSTLAYANQSPSPDIGPNEILVFDMDIVSVKSNGVETKVVDVPGRQQTTPVKAKPKPAAKPAVKPKQKTITTTKKAG
jgi:FKBP-type peptidyl-prolyl cis-trans isomerase FkpA